MAKVFNDQQRIDYARIYSPSRLKLFDQCPQQYFFSYLDPVKKKMKSKLKQMPENIYSFHTLGKAVHNAITLFYHLPLSQRNRENLMKKLEEVWISEARWNKKPPLLQWGGFGSVEEERGVYREAIKMLENFLEIAEENPTIHYLPIEDFRRSIKDYQDLIVPLTDNYDISGKFDLITKDKDGGLHIIDFKTSKKEEKDQFQLDFYKLLAELNFDQPVKKTSFFFLKTGKKKSFSTKGRTEKIKEKILKKIETVSQAKEFKPKTSKLCKYCLFVSFCPAKKEAGELVKEVKDEDLYSDDLPF